MATDNTSAHPPLSELEQSAKNVALVVYVLQAFSFVTVVTYLIGLIINYVKRDDVANTWIATHFRWQIRTFWFSLLWGLIGLATAPIFIGYVILMANAIWIIYRIVRGWLALNDNQSLYQE
ncbi:hypothetical protein QCB45_02910 [Thiomicrorhabdus sp. ZW0627]|uniref:DUF4870 family protein n=1 Tax=Thiomicrorhabdus sp. ZW0627 TaxID=3039774 RepID=UPI0024372FED|nr:hypothetical protein [Thiomicrorhabdus sp. ZW0627]MDG6773269.1 hypothetical protein [Thiomicrorhabdus sp. ZW0627]